MRGLKKRIIRSDRCTQRDRDKGIIISLGLSCLNRYISETKDTYLFVWETEPYFIDEGETESFEVDQQTWFETKPLIKRFPQSPFLCTIFRDFVKMSIRSNRNDQISMHCHEIETPLHPPTSTFLLIGVLGPRRVVQPHGLDYPRGGPNPPSPVQLRRTMALLRELWQQSRPRRDICQTLMEY